MLAKKNSGWLLLLVRLPATHSAERVAIWRKLKKSGAIQIQTSTYVLPDDPPRYETFQWLTQHIRDAGGDATLVRAREIEGLPNERLIELFNAARTKEYAALRQMLRPF
ncbi:MAG: Chromate resistance protein ChrB, partial [Alphaproteobacteria bacterium]